MHAAPIKLLNLLGENKTTFNIPVYQRNYEWKHEHIEKAEIKEKSSENDTVKPSPCAGVKAPAPKKE
ncbi:MAG: hypothetical protein GX996_08195 [Firmicutes bacterium]|nr:hypothetical protein [Bacillota bacterium]